MRQLQRAREMAGVAFRINSGWRCEVHNAKVGGAPESSHLAGHAADIAAVSSSQRFAIINGLVKAGFNRIGVSRTFIHADNSQSKAQDVIWLY